MKRAITFSIILPFIVCLLAGISSMATPAPSLVSPPFGGFVTTCGIYTFDWTSLSSAWYLDKYHIVIDDGPDLSGDVVHRSYPTVSSRNVDISACRDNTVYYWGVQTNGRLTIWDAWAWSSMTTGTFYTDFPGLETISPADGATGVSQKPTLTWSEHCHHKDIYCWRIVIDDNSNFGSLVADWTVSGGIDPINGVTLPGGLRLAPATKYYWKALGLDTECSENITGWTNVGTFTTCPAPNSPSLVTPGNGALDAALPVNVEWGQVSDADEYNLQIADNVGLTSPVINLNQTGTQYLASILDEGTQYYWRVRAYSDNCGWSGWSSTWNFTVECPLPDAPSLAVPPSGETNLARPVNLQWNTVSEAINYKLQVADNFSFVEPVFEIVTGDLNYDVGDLTDATKYYWRVSAENDCGWGIWSNIWNFTADCPTLNPPVIVYPTDGQDNLDVREFVNLDWDDVSGAVGYGLQVSEDESMTDPLVDEEGIVTSTYSINEPLQIELWYYWRVNTEKDVCGYGDWSTVWKFQLLCPTAEVPTLSSPANGTISVTQPITIDWDDIAEADKYHVQVDNNKDFSSMIVSDNNVVPSDLVLPNLFEGINYYWRVRAYNGCQWGDWSDVWSFVSGEQTDVEIRGRGEIPREYSLKQNYPNPFNPKTTIEFAIPRAEHIILEIHNILGEKVATVLSKNLTAGHYSVNWDATEKTTGVYFYRIQAGNFIQTRKMILMK